MTVLKRSAHAVLAEFEAFERFKTMNGGANSTSWSRDRQGDLCSKLTYELGSKTLGQLQAYALLTSSPREREDVCLKLITQALIEIGDRDRPQTQPPEGSAIF
jgi:hypothetical protein